MPGSPLCVTTNKCERFFFGVSIIPAFNRVCYIIKQHDLLSVAFVSPPSPNHPFLGNVLLNVKITSKSIAKIAVNSMSSTNGEN